MQLPKTSAYPTSPAAPQGTDPAPLGGMTPRNPGCASSFHTYHGRFLLSQGSATSFPRAINP